MPKDVQEEKRLARSYKVRDTPYNDAMKRAKKEKKGQLSQLIEKWVTAYANGAEIEVVTKSGK